MASSEIAQIAVWLAGILLLSGQREILKFCKINDLDASNRPGIRQK